MTSFIDKVTNSESKTGGIAIGDHLNDAVGHCSTVKNATKAYEEKRQKDKQD